MGVSPSTLAVLQILAWPGVGPASLRKVVASSEGNADLLELAAEKLRVTREARQQAIAKTKATLDDCERYDVGLLSMLDEGFSACLAHIPDCPPIVFYKGSVENLKRPSVAVVGTRKASEAGLRIARTISRVLASKEHVVVSGLALGIDTAAHRGALDAHGRTIAVLAHGLDRVSPASNRALAQEILDHDGTLLSEHPPGFPARPAEFVRRNRIQSGLSIGSVIVESGVEGGAIHQANFTRKQGRHLMVALARDEEHRDGLNEAGARHLMQSLGASAITGTADLFRELEKGKRSLETVAPEPQAGFEW